MFISQMFFGISFCFLILNQIYGETVSRSNSSVLSVAVVGAGVSGLCSAKHAIAQGFNVTVFEQTEEIGGIWFYTDEIGKDQYGVGIHTSMYQELR